MTKEFNHKYLGYGRVPSECIIRMLTDDGDTFICFIDIGEGTSVTNASERLATEIVNKFQLHPEDCRFFETYREFGYDTFDEIEYKWWPDQNQLGWNAEEPKWKPVDDNVLITTFIS